MTWRKREIMDEIHSCSPFCTQPMCVAVRDAVQAEREACAKIFDEVMPLVTCAQNYQGGCLVCGFTPKLAAAAIRARSLTSCTHEWIDATTTKPQWHCAKCGEEYAKEQA
jgi:hypothetical protein